MKELLAKIKEALVSALPITLLVYLLALLPSFSFNKSEMVAFTVGAVLLVLGIGFFNLGADIAMTPMGNHVGAGLSRQKKIGLLLTVCFVLGVLITIAEPDLQVLANQISSVMNGKLLIYTVGFGVGAFLVVAILRIVFRKNLSNILMLFYMLLFAMALMLSINDNIALLPMAFDSGGVASGPITVPFIMALGVGISKVLGDRRSQENSFGLVALCSIGPILSVLVLGIFARKDINYTVNYGTVEGNVWRAYLENAGHVAKEVAVALGLIVIFFLICQVFFLKLHKRQLIKIGVGVVFTYMGLVLFLTGVNVGYMPIGYKMGMQLSLLEPWVLVAIGLMMGVLSLFSWDGYHSLFIAVGLMINTLCMGLCDAQDLRKSVLITCPMVLIYNVFELSYSGMINESISLISAAIGILRYKKHP